MQMTHACSGRSTRQTRTHVATTTAADERVVTERHSARTADGWVLELKRSFIPRHFDNTHHPLLIVPGYGMNSFIFGYHPRGTSMINELATRGFEVWTVNLRSQEGTHRARHDAPGPSLERHALYDLPAAIDAVLGATHTTRDKLALLGCSLGGTFCYLYLTHHDDSKVHSMVAMGTPFRWEKAHPAVRFAFSSPRIAGLFSVKGTRRSFELAYPFVSKMPRLLAPYVNVANVDMHAVHELAATVEDPHPRINQDLARWITERDLVVRGQNLSDAVKKLSQPLLLVVANKDGIVPEGAARPVLSAWGGDDHTLISAGDSEKWFAHADLFIANDAPEKVFHPIAEWIFDRE